MYNRLYHERTAVHYTYGHTKFHYGGMASRPAHHAWVDQCRLLSPHSHSLSSSTDTNQYIFLNLELDRDEVMHSESDDDDDKLVRKMR